MFIFTGGMEDDEIEVEFGIRLYAILENLDLMLQTRSEVGNLGPPLIFVNEVLLEHSHLHSFTCGRSMVAFALQQQS